jgi:hypothetical protein
VKLLIAISSCYDWEKNGNNDVLRETWLDDVRNIPYLDYMFFFGTGQGAELEEGTGDFLPFGIRLVQHDRSVLLDDVEDDYGHLSYKTRGSLRWADARGYDFVYRCFPDTYCRPERLISCGFAKHDYVGDFRGEHCTPDNYPSGGPGYFLSRRAWQFVLNAPIEGPEAMGKHTRVWPYAEDLWVGQVLNWHRDIGLKYFDDNRFVNRGTSHPGPLRTNSIISTHLSCPDRYYPERMREKHREWLAS